MLSDKEFEQIVRESIREELELLREGVQTVFIWSDDFGKTYGLYDKVKGNPKPIVKGNPRSMTKLLSIVSPLSKDAIEQEMFETQDGEQYGEIKVAMKKLEGLKRFVKEAKLEKEKFTEPDQMRMYELEESRASKFLAVLGLTGALLGIGKINSSDPVMKAIKAKTEQADTPAEKKALKDLATARLIYLDTGKGEGGNISVKDVVKVVNESAKPYGKGDKVKAHITGDVPTTYLIQGPPKKSPLGLAYRAKNLRSGKVVGLLHSDITG